MLTAQQREAIMARALAVPIVSTLKMQVRGLAEGYCETFVERDRIFDGIMETQHGGLLMTIADTTACWAILTDWGPRARLAKCRKSYHRSGHRGSARRSGRCAGRRVPSSDLPRRTADRRVRPIVAAR